MEAHANVRDMGLIEAKLAYIKAWQALPEFGISYFVIKMANGKKEVFILLYTSSLKWQMTRKRSNRSQTCLHQGMAGSSRSWNFILCH